MIIAVESLMLQLAIINTKNLKSSTPSTIIEKNTFISNDIDWAAAILINFPKIEQDVLHQQKFILFWNILIFLVRKIELTWNLKFVKCVSSLKEMLVQRLPVATLENDEIM